MHAVSEIEKQAPGDYRVAKRRDGVLKMRK